MEASSLISWALHNSGAAGCGKPQCNACPGSPGHPGKARLGQIRTGLVSTAVPCNTQPCFQADGNLGAEVWLHPPNFGVGLGSK